MSTLNTNEAKQLLREIMNLAISDMNENDVEHIEIIQFKTCFVKSKTNMFPRLCFLFDCAFVCYICDNADSMIQRYRLIFVSLSMLSVKKEWSSSTLWPLLPGVLSQHFYKLLKESTKEASMVWPIWL